MKYLSAGLRTMVSAVAFLSATAGSIAQSSPSDPTVQYSATDGSSIAKAIVITGAPSETVGVKAEYRYIHEHFPVATTGRQSLISRANRHYDSIEFVTGKGEARTIFIDITDFFGKY